MQEPRNFDKVNHTHFISHSGKKFEIQNGTVGVWILPDDADYYTHVILIDIKWANYIAHLSFPAKGQGTNGKLMYTADEILLPSNIETMYHFVDWCRNKVHKYEKFLKQ